MARPKTGNRRLYTKPTMTYLTPTQRRGLEAAAERDEMPASTWLRRLIVAELSRVEARERIAAQA